MALLFTEMMAVELESCDERTEDMVCEEVYASTQGNGNALNVWGHNCCSDASFIPNLTSLLHPHAGPCDFSLQKEHTNISIKRALSSLCGDTIAVLAPLSEWSSIRISCEKSNNDVPIPS